MVPKFQMIRDPAFQQLSAMVTNGLQLQGRVKIAQNILDYNLTDLIVFVIIVNQTRGSKLMVLVKNVYPLKRCQLMVNHAKRLLVKLEKSKFKESVLIVNCIKEGLKTGLNVVISVLLMKKFYGMETVKSVGMALWHHLWIINRVLQKFSAVLEKK